MDGEGDDSCVLHLDGHRACIDGLVDLFQQGLLTDVSLVTDDGTSLPCHRVILAAASPFFRALFAGPGSAAWQEGATPEVALHGVDGATLRSLVAAVYTRQLHAPATQLPLLLAGASQLALASLASACTDQLRLRLCPTSALATASLACALGIAALEEDADAYAGQHFDEVLLSDSDGVLALAEDRLERLLGSDRLRVDSEADALEALLSWASCRVENLHQVAVFHNLPSVEDRLRALPRLLRRVRLCLMPPELLLSRAAEHPACVACPDAAAMLQRAALERTRLGVGYSGQPRDSTPLRLLVVGGHDAEWRPLRSAEWYDTRTDTWQAAPAPPPVDAWRSTSAFLSAIAGRTESGTREMLAVGGSAYVCTALRAVAPPPVAGQPSEEDRIIDDDGVVHQLPLHWYACRPPSARQHGALACVDGFQCASIAFLIGGRAGAGATELTTVECCELGGWTPWRTCPSLARPRASGAAVALQDCIYVAGGQSGRITFDSVECLHTGRMEWMAQPCATLLQARKYLSLVTLRGCLYAVGGMLATRARLACVERLDPREGKWQMVASMHAKRSSASCVSAASALWVAGGYDGVLYHSSVEKYEDRMNTWTKVKSMATARSGAAMVAI